MTDVSGSELFTLSDLAERYNWTYGTARSYHGACSGRRNRGESKPGDLPAPDLRFGRSPVWLRASLDEWDKVRPGAPSSLQAHIESVRRG